MYKMIYIFFLYYPQLKNWYFYKPKVKLYIFIYFLSVKSQQPNTKAPPPSNVLMNMKYVK